MTRLQPLILLLLVCSATINAQNVGIGTTSPHAGSILDLGTSRPLLLPRLTRDQMLAVLPVTPGQIIYNSTEHQLYGYMRYRTTTFIGQSNNRWEPISTGPRMLAYGYVDSFANEVNGSNNFSVTWNSTDRWYELNLTSPHEYYRDSMVLMVTAVGNGSWDQAVSTGELISGSSRKATIKFTDVSRIASGWSVTDARRRSNFHIVVYDLRKNPY
jgi:hypothetical protein